MALVADINGVCRSGGTRDHLVADESRPMKHIQLDDRESVQESSLCGVPL